MRGQIVLYSSRDGPCFFSPPFLSLPLSLAISLPLSLSLGSQSLVFQSNWHFTALMLFTSVGRNKHVPYAEGVKKTGPHWG